MDGDKHRAGEGQPGVAPGVPDPNGTFFNGSYHQAGPASFTVTGSGEIGPDVPGGPDGLGVTAQAALTGVFAALIVVIIVAALFIAAEYRRGMIRVTLAAAPSRWRVLAAKSVVIFLATFVVSLIAVGISLPLGLHVLHGGGTPVDPVPAAAQAGIIVGCALMLALSAVLALAIGAMARRSVLAIVAVIVVIFIPFLLAQSGNLLPVSAQEWLLRVLPVAAVSAQQAYPAYHQVIAPYTPMNGYYPLSPLAGLGCWSCGLRRPSSRPAGCCAGGTRERGGPRRGRALDVPAAARPGLSSSPAALALHAEWTKFRTLPGTPWLLAATAVLTCAVGTAVSAAFSCAPGFCSPADTGADPARLALAGLYLGQVLAACGGVLVVGGEYDTGMIRVTLAAMPRRLWVLAAKAVVVLGAVLVAALAGVLGSFLTGRLLLPGRGLSAANGYVVLSLSNGTDLRAFGCAVAYLVLIALMAVGIATAVRNSGAAIGIAAGLLLLFPIIGGVVPSHWLSRHLSQISPMAAGFDAQATVGLKGLPLTPWQGLGVVGLWAAGALLLGALVLRLRDA